jgi:integrase
MLGGWTMSMAWMRMPGHTWTGAAASFLCMWVFQQLLTVAGRVHPLLKLALIVAEGTGRRLSAWRNLRWDDVDFPNRSIHWRAENDKQGHDQVVPISQRVHAALAEARRAQGAIGSRAVFPAPKDAARPCRRNRSMRGSGERSSSPGSRGSRRCCGTRSVASGPPSGSGIP